MSFGVIIVVLILFVVVLSLVFLALQLLKKFVFLGEYTKSNTCAQTWYYDGLRKPGMYNIALRSDAQFGALVAFKLDLPLGYSGVDPFGYVSSDRDGIVVIFLYLGRSPVDFIFLFNTDNTVQISSSDADQKITPTAIYLLHWWQKLGIFG